jgi:hypothetical protein
MAELFAATMTPKERVKDFNQIFTTILNKFQPDREINSRVANRGLCQRAPGLSFHVRKKSHQANPCGEF